MDENAKGQARLSRDDWIEAGFAALAEGGIQAVRVEPLARALGVSKGSFYWHFRDRAALTEAMLDAWEQLTTDQVIDTTGRAATDASARLLQVLYLVTEIDDRLDPAVRGWATVDAAVADRLRAVDLRRIAFVQGMFRDMGFDESVTAARARLVYTSMIGEELVGDVFPVTDRRKLARLNHAMLTRPAGGPP